MARRYPRIRVHYHFASGYRGYIPDVSESFKDQQQAREYFNHFVEETIDIAYQSSDSEGRQFESNTEIEVKEVWRSLIGTAHFPLGAGVEYAQIVDCEYSSCNPVIEQEAEIV